MSARPHDLAAVARAAVDAIGPLLADLKGQVDTAKREAEKLVTDLKAAHERELALLRAEVKAQAEAARAIPRDGRDATFREPVDYEAGKTFPFGAIVRHRGGLWHAHRETDAAPEAERSGWTLICAGINAVTVELAPDHRSFSLVVEGSRGDPVRHTFALPSLVYRGVWNSRASYKQGDAVTVDGSTWIARRDTKQRPAPYHEGTASDWQLAVKCGLNGKDGDAGKSAPAFAGFFDPRQVYPADVIVRTSSGLWLSERATNEPPPAQAVVNGEAARAGWRLYLPMVTH